MLHRLLAALRFVEPRTFDHYQRIAAQHPSVARSGRDFCGFGCSQGLCNLLRFGALHFRFESAFVDVRRLADMLDTGVGAEAYRRALEAQVVKVDDPSRTPSALMLSEMRENGESFHALAWRLSRRHQKYFQSRGIYGEAVRRLEEEASLSCARQVELETRDNLSFDAFLENYFNQA